MLKNAFHNITFSYQFLSPRLCESREFLRKHNTATRSVRFIKPKERSSICCTPTWSRESWNFAAHLSKKWLRYSEENSWWKYQTKCHRQQRYMHRRRSLLALPLSSRKNTRVLRRFLPPLPPPWSAPSIFLRFYLSPFFLRSSVLFLLLHNPLHFSASAGILLRLVHGFMIFYLALSSIFSSLTRLRLYIREWAEGKHFEYIISSADSLQWLPK